MSQSASTAKAPTLEDVLQYTNDDVVYRFQKTYAVSREESEDIFEQVKKWLWLAHVRRCSGIAEGLSVDHPIVVIDEMWHNFVLFTKEYTAFCLRFFGYYLHHAPATEREERAYRDELRQVSMAERRALLKDRKRIQYEYIYDHLGKDTFVKWYLEYPRRYSYRRLAELHLQSLDQMVLIEPPIDPSAPWPDPRIPVPPSSHVSLQENTS
jgi:hypothetical protein